jgi:hypothetical protein
MYWALSKLSGGRAKEWGTREVMPEPLAVPAATEHQLALTGAGVDA